MLWSQASTPKPSENLHPSAFGWKTEEGIVVPVWFEGSSVPTTLIKGDVANNVSMQMTADDTLDDEVEEWSEDESDNEN